MSHSLSVISLQVGGVRRLLAPEQEKERTALLSVEQVARGAVEEMHHMLGLLRDDGQAGGLAPQPGLGDLPTLFRETPVEAALEVDGTERMLSPGIELAAYRIVQEALTNVAKHSNARHADVVLRYGSGALEVVITDRGAPTGTGMGVEHGLRGMRERVAVYKGRLDAGPVPDGGWRVTATLPYPQEPG